MGRLILVTGGARSGKSSFAERYAAKYGRKIAYIATSQVLDEEMRFRVGLHRSRRPADWDTYEAPFDAHEAVREAAAGHDMLLFDCLTVYISNLLCGLEDIEDSDRNYALVKRACDSLVAAVQAGSATLVAVTNEVGDGIVPMNRLAREFRDLSGLANQLLAKHAEEVYLVTAGIPVNIRQLEYKL
ncbi:bifunctional adenosylcobinamide kinase/adenosylcobinamide-phosphate guanylyltransferase [Anaerovibrio sp.]|uniref:bifunctional adenosylcobinamide kinase/adenosylcobinamide-phosphate guanylyltransferase n=1 Tax=Anaerovibrio sp. TaxID=1872532 RepID=UPI003F163A78